MVFKNRLSQRWSRSAERLAALRTQDARQLLLGLLARERVTTLPQVDILPECVIHAETHAAHDADADRGGRRLHRVRHGSLHGSRTPGGCRPVGGWLPVPEQEGQEEVAAHPVCGVPRCARLSATTAG